MRREPIAPARRGPRWPLPLLLAVALVGACGGSEPSGGNDNENDNGNTNQNDNGNTNQPTGNGWDVPGDPSQFRRCDAAAPPSGLPTVGWEHLANEVITLDTDHHWAQDVLASTAHDSAVVGKFTYGAISKDLEGERVEVWVDNCSGSYLRLGEAITDSDGRIALPVAAAEMPPVGAYAVWLRVMGDNTTAESTFWAFPPATRIMVFDIDGTLTTDDLELVGDVMADLFEPIGAGTYVPEARAGGLELTGLRRDTQGHVLVYLTGRPYLLQTTSREWLTDLGFPAGPLHLCDDVADVLPNNDAVGAYKAAYLSGLQGLGFVIDAAYGNASTDVYAYAQVGVDLARTFILGENGGVDGTVDLGDDYVAHLPGAAADPVASQPFTW